MQLSIRANYKSLGWTASKRNRAVAARHGKLAVR